MEEPRPRWNISDLERRQAQNAWVLKMLYSMLASVRYSSEKFYKVFLRRMGIIGTEYNANQITLEDMKEQESTNAGK